jgi:hypothetical protein
MSKGKKARLDNEAWKAAQERIKNKAGEQSAKKKKNAKKPKNPKVGVQCNIVMAFLERLQLEVSKPLMKKLCTMILTFGLGGFAFKMKDFTKLGKFDRTTYANAFRALAKCSTFEIMLLTSWLQVISKESRGGKLPPANILFDDTIALKKIPGRNAYRIVSCCGKHFSHLEHKMVYGHQYLVTMLCIGSRTIILDMYLYNNSGSLTPASRAEMEELLKVCRTDIDALKAKIKQARARKAAIEGSDEFMAYSDLIKIAAEDLRLARSVLDQAVAFHAENLRNTVAITFENKAREIWQKIKKAKEDIEAEQNALLKDVRAEIKLLADEITAQNKHVVKIRFDYIGKVTTKIEHLNQKFGEWSEIFRALSKATSLYASGDSWFVCESLIKAVQKCGATYIGAIKSNRTLYKNGKKISISELARTLTASQLEEVVLGAEECPPDAEMKAANSEAPDGGSVAGDGEGVLDTESLGEAQSALIEFLKEHEVPECDEDNDVEDECTENEIDEDDEECSDGNYEEHAFDDEAEFGKSACKKARSYQVFRYEGRLKGIDKAVVLLCWKTGRFHKSPVRAFVCMDCSLTTKEILQAYAVRWKIETFFQGAKRLGLGSFQLRDEDKLTGCFRLLILMHTFCSIGLDKPMTLAEGTKWLADRQEELVMRGVEAAVHDGSTHEEIWAMFH